MSSHDLSYSESIRRRNARKKVYRSLREVVEVLKAHPDLTFDPSLVAEINQLLKPIPIPESKS